MPYNSFTQEIPPARIPPIGTWQPSEFDRTVLIDTQSAMSVMAREDHLLFNNTYLYYDITHENTIQLLPPRCPMIQMRTGQTKLCEYDPPKLLLVDLE